MPDSQKVIDIVFVTIGWAVLFVMFSGVAVGFSHLTMIITNSWKKKEDQENDIFKTPEFWVFETIAVLTVVISISWGAYKAHKEKSLITITDTKFGK